MSEFKLKQYKPVMSLDNGMLEPYHFILSTRAHEHLGELRNIDMNTLTVNGNMNAANEISFTIYKETYGDDGELIENPLWDDIVALKYIYCPEMEQYFSIDPSDDDNVGVVSKTITATDAAIVELSNINIYDLQVNNESDPNWAPNSDEYKKTVFFSGTTPELSLLNRALDRAPQWKVVYVDDSLKELQRSFSVDGTSIYDFLTGDCAEQFNCILEFNSVNREISAYDLYAVCLNDDCNFYRENNERYRGEFQYNCPKCGSSHLQIFGHDTTVFVNSMNLTDDIQFTTDTDSIKNCFKLEAGDDIINTALKYINPTGANEITYFTDEMRNDMPKALRDKLDEYDAKYEKVTTQDEID